MLVSSLTIALLAAGYSTAVPLTRRTTLNPQAVAEAQQRDDTATRAFTGVSITNSAGLCLSVNATAGDFRENLIPIQMLKCDGSTSQSWDVLTSGKHNNVSGQALFVSDLTNGCLNFDPRRAAGNQVLVFSCGGRGDGSGQTATSQLFAFDAGEGAKPFPLIPLNGNNNTCLTVTNGLLDQTSCNTAQPSTAELFTIHTGGQAAAQAGTKATTQAAPPAASTKVTAEAAPPAASTAASAPPSSQPICILPPAAAPPPAQTAVAAESAKATTQTTSTAAAAATLPPGTVKLDAAATAEAQQRDATATRALSGVTLRTAGGDCVFVDPLSGDFRENLTPAQVGPCNGAAGEKWDVITAGKHNNVPGAALIVSTLTQACLQFDSRKNVVNLFSCGGRADGSGQVSGSQLFPFSSGKTRNVPLLPQNENNNTCLTVNGGLLSTAACTAATASGNELFTFE